MSRSSAASEPTPMQTLMLWALVVRGGAAKQQELQPQPTKSDRDALVRAGLVVATKAGRAWRLDLSDHGWAWLGANTRQALPNRSNKGCLVLAALLQRLGHYMAVREVALADLINPAPAAPAAAPPASPAAGLASRIRAAYLAASGGKVNRRARLAAIRAALADVPRAELDAALLALAHAGEAELLPLDDPTEIGAADRAAALPIGVEQRHLLWLHR